MKKGKCISKAIVILLTVGLLSGAFGSEIPFLNPTGTIYADDPTSGTSAGVYFKGETISPTEENNDSKTRLTFSPASNPEDGYAPGEMADYNNYSRSYNEAFHSGFLHIVFEEGVKNIGANAFPEYEVRKVNIPSSVTEIGAYAFGKCVNLPEIIIPDTVKKIDHSAFYHCTLLTSLDFPGGVTDLGDAIFFDCTGLQTVSFASGATVIGKAMFSSCTSLTEVSIPNTVKTIKEDAFKDCLSINAVKYEGSEAGWAKIEIESGNESLTGATFTYGNHDAPEDDEKNDDSEKTPSVPEKQKKAEEAVKAGKGSSRDTVTLAPSPSKKNTYTVELSENSILTIAKGNKFTIANNGATEFASDNSSYVSVSKKGVVKGKKVTGENPAQITFKGSDGKPLSLTVYVLDPAIDTEIVGGSSIASLNKTSITTKIDESTDVDAVFPGLPLNTEFGTVTDKKKAVTALQGRNKLWFIGADGNYHIGFRGVAKGKVKIPCTVNGKKYTIKINVKK